MMRIEVGELFATVIGVFQKGFRLLILLMIFCISLQGNSQTNIPDSIINRAAALPVEKKISYYNKLIFDYARNNPEAARVLIDSVFTLLESHPNSAEQVYAQRAAGYYQLHQNNYDSAIYFYKHAQKINMEENDSTTKLGLLIDFGILHERKNTSDSALYYYQMADSFAGIYNNLRIKNLALLNMGGVYQRNKLDDVKALKYLEEAYQLIEYSSSLNKISLYNMLSIVYRNMDRDSLALVMANNSYNLAMDEGLLGDAAAATNSMALIYQENEEYHKALKAFITARDIAEKLNITRGIIFTNANIAHTYYELGEYDKGLELFEKVLIMVQKNHMSKVELNIYQELLLFYEKLGNYQKAYEISENYRKLSDSLELKEKEKHIAELETRYQTHLKEDTIADQKAQIRAKRNMIWFLSLLVFIVLASLMIISRLFVLKNKSLKNLVKAHQELSKKNQQILKLIPCQMRDNMGELNQDEDFVYQKSYTYLITKRNFLDEELSLDKLAEGIGINREYIRNAIKSTEGCNFKTFLNNHRIDHAKELIMGDAMNKLSIEEIARQSGFSSRTSFYRTFHDITGFTPAFYRNQIRKTTDRIA